MIERASFLYFVCPECRFDMVQTADFAGATDCPLCNGAYGYTCVMVKRECRSTDRPEGFDARNHIMDWKSMASAPQSRRILLWTGVEMYAGHWAKNALDGTEAWVIARVGDDGEQIILPIGAPILWTDAPALPVERKAA